MPGRVDRAAHQPAERVDLANEMALRRAADRRIARHVRDGVGRQRAEPDVRAEPRRGVRRFAARVPRADHDDVESALHAICVALFPDTEPREDVLEHILRRAAAGDFLERARAPANRPARIPPASTARRPSAALARAQQRVVRALDERDVPHVGDRRPIAQQIDIERRDDSLPQMRRGPRRSSADTAIADVDRPTPAGRSALFATISPLYSVFDVSRRRADRPPISTRSATAAL